MADLTGLRILIAGAGKGIGATTARMAAERGAIVSVGDIDHSVATSLAESINNQAGGKAHAFQFDISSESSVQDFITQSVHATGGLDCLINMAAAINLVAAGLDTNIEEMDPSIWQKTFDVNLTGFALTTKHSIPHLKTSSCGSIVNISSASAIQGDVLRAAYAASKAGVQALTRHTATLLAPHGVRVNAVAPGITATEDVVALTEKLGLEGYLDGVLLKRMAEPREVASVVLFLISREAGYVTGQVWGVDGGTRFRE